MISIPFLQRRAVLVGLGGLALAPAVRAQALGDACRPDPAEAQGAFVVRFGDPVRVWFVATRHSQTLGSQTFQTVAAAIEQARPALVIVEGVETAAGESPDAETLRDMSEAGFRDGESRYAAMLAAKRGIPYVGGEVSARAVNDALLKTHPLRDVIQAYLVRDIAGLARLRPFRDEAEFRRFVRYAADRLAVSDGRLWDAEMAEGDWYLEAHPLEAPPPNFGAPCVDDAAGRILAQVTRLRNLHLRDLIVARARTAAPVLVVYGSGHLRALRSVLEKRFGPALP